MVGILRNHKLFEEFLIGLAQVDHKTVDDVESIQRNIKTTFKQLESQVVQLKKRPKKGSKFKVPAPAPSLETIKEEKPKDDKNERICSPSTSSLGNITGRPKRTAAVKASEVAPEVVIKRTKRGRPRKRKSSSSPTGRPVSKNRREETLASQISRKILSTAGEKEDTESKPAESRSDEKEDNKISTVEIRDISIKDPNLSGNKQLSKDCTYSKANNTKQSKDCTYTKANLDVNDKEASVVDIIVSPVKSTDKTEAKVVEKAKAIVTSPDSILKEDAEVQKSSLSRKSPRCSPLKAEEDQQTLKPSTEPFQGFALSPDKKSEELTVTVPTNEQPSLKRPHPLVISSSEDEESPKSYSKSKIVKKTSLKKTSNDVRIEPSSDLEADADNAKISPGEKSGDNKASADILRPPEMLPPKRITRSKLAKPKENVEPQVNSQFSSSEDSSTPEKRCTRSKMAKPKENVDPQVKSQSPSSEDSTTPEKRCTRSKLVKPKPNSDSDSGRGETSSSEERRCTRSKMAKANKQKAAIDSAKSGEESPEPMTGSHEGKTIIKQKINVKSLKDIFSPGIIRDQEKENQLSAIYKSLTKKPGERFTPLQVRNAFVTPAKTSKIPLVSSAMKSKSVLEVAEKRKKEEEALRKRLKEDEALRKKQEIVKAKQEEMRRKNEEKKMKCAAIREAAEKEKTELQIRLEKEREERERAARELLERKKEEEVLKKKMAHQTKALEAESRRLKEEAARLAKIKEMEEEQRQQEELRIKQQEETERILKQRQEEMRLKEAAMKAREQQKKKMNVPVKDKDNYDINDLEEDDDSEMESTDPKKDIPLWARKGEDRERQDRIHALIDMDIIREYYACPSKTPDLTELFGKMTMKRVRTSSAVWLDTPPLRK